MKRPQILEARAGVGHGVVDVNDKFIKEGTTRLCVCHGEIHTRMKLTSLEIINRLSWRLEEVSDVGWAMVSWTIASRSYILVVT